jgi:hypothetical protein
VAEAVMLAVAAVQEELFTETHLFLLTHLLLLVLEVAVVAILASTEVVFLATLLVVLE